MSFGVPTRRSNGDVFGLCLREKTRRVILIDEHVTSPGRCPSLRVSLSKFSTDHNSEEIGIHVSRPAR